MWGGKGRWLSGGDRSKRVTSLENVSPHTGDKMGIGKEEEICRLRELNPLLMKDIKNLRQEKACFLQKLTHMESHIGEFQSKIDNLHGELLEQAKIGQRLKEDQKEFREQCERKSEEYRAAISKQLQEAEEIFKKETFEKEEECRAVVSDKRILESTVSQLNCEIQVISAELEASHNGWKLEKDEHALQIAAAIQETEEVAKGNPMAEQTWNTEKDKLLSSLASHKKKIEEMSMENERLLVQSRAEKNEMQSMLNELVEDKHFWISENGNLKSQVAELQTKLDVIASERGILRQKNGEEEEDRTSRLVETQNQRVEELETALHSVKEDHECKERQYLEVGSLIIENGKSKSNSLLENGKLKPQQRVEELETALRSVKEGLECKERQSLQVRPLITENGRSKSNSFSENGKLKLKPKQRVEDLETTLHFVKEDLEGKERQSLQVRPLILENGKTKSNSLLENGKLKPQQRVEELETALHSVKEDLECKERQSLEVRPLIIGNGKSKSNSLLENGKLKPQQTVEELETALHSVKEDLECKERQSLEVRPLITENGKAKSNSLLENGKLKPQQRVEELETSLHSVKEDLECKEHQSLEVRPLLTENGKSKSNSLLENGKLKPKQRVEELETALHSVKEDHECKERQSLQLRPLITENGKSKSNSLLENGKLKPKLVLESKDGKPKYNVAIEMRKSNGLLERATPPKTVYEKRTSAKPLSENRTPLKLIPETQTPNKVPTKRTPSSLTPEKKTPKKLPENRTLSKLTPSKLTAKQSPNIRPEKPWR